MSRKLLILLSLYFAFAVTNTSLLHAQSPGITVRAQKVLEAPGIVESAAINTEGDIFFSDITNKRIYKFTPQGELTVFLENPGRPKGITFDLDGRLIMCEDDSAQVTRLENDNSVTVLASAYDGKRLNRPNDLAVWKDGSIYFTDSPSPSRFQRSRAPHGVYRIKPNGEILQVVADPDRRSLPNGIAFSPDQNILYVLDTNLAKLSAYELDENGIVLSAVKLMDVTMPDGMTVDKQGNLFITEYHKRRIVIASSDGQEIGQIDVPEHITSNCVFSPTKPESLYISAGQSVYKAQINRTTSAGERLEAI